MSNTTPTPVVCEEALDVVCPTLPETEVVAPETEQPQPKKKNVLARVFGALLAAVSVAIVFLTINVFSGTAAVETTLLDAVKDLFSDKANKLFGALPALADTATVNGQIATLALYAFALGLVLSVVFGVITVFCPKFLRTTAFFSSAGFFTYAVSLYAVTKGEVLDIICLAVAAVGVVIFLALAFAKQGKKAFVSLLQLVLTLVVFAAVAYGTTKFNADFVAGLETLGLTVADTVFLAVIVVLALDLTVGYIRMQTKGCLVVDFIRYALQLVIGGAVCYLAIASKADTTFLITAIVAAVVSVLQIVVAVLQSKAGKEKVETPVEEPAVEEAVEEEFVREEYAEALPYEGGPVEGVEVAEEVNPTYVAPLPEVQTAGYDFYNSKSFDPFIAVLNNEERNQFTELFILKYKGVMPEIPDYVVGGDNKDFFRKLFIYLGQYRDRIPDGLLAKIYQFAIKM